MCPSKFPFSNDWSVLERGGRIRVKGKIIGRNLDLSAQGAHIPPLSDQYTVRLKPSNNPIYFMKFPLNERSKALSFTVGEIVDVEGDLTRYCRRGLTKHILTCVSRV